MKYAYLFLRLTILFFSFVNNNTKYTSASYTGNVFRDFNANGLKKGKTNLQFLKTVGLVLFLMLFAKLSTTIAQCAITLKPTVSGCYQNGGVSKTTVSVEVAWVNATVSPTANDASDAITVTFAGQTRTINPGAYTSTGGNGTIASPQIVAFEVNADASTQTIQAFFGADYASSTCKNEQIGVVLPAACQPLPCTGNQTGGQVFNDYNADGIKQAGETQGLAGVTIKAFDCNGVEVGSTTTDVTGKYVFSSLTAANYPIRVEFSDLPALYGQGTRNGTNGRTTTQFVTAASCNVNLGVLNPNDYCQNNANVILPVYLNGDPNDAGSANDAAIVSVNYALNAFAKTVIAKIPEVASVWGVAFDKNQNQLYSSAFLRRHMGLTNAGLGGIFKSNLTTNTTSLWLDVETIGVNLGTIGDNISRGVNVAKNQPSIDAESFAKVAKVGMGGVDLSEDGSTLYFVNLFEKTLHRVNTATPTAAPSVAIPNPNCTGGTYRPWSLKIYKGFAYVGVVCDASTGSKSDLRAYVYRCDLATNVFDPTPVFDFPLTYPKGFVAAAQKQKTGWYGWTDTEADLFGNTYVSGPDIIVYPQPIFSDIEFDVDGSMVLGFADRTGFQTGYANYSPSGGNGSTNKGYSGYLGGDILRATFSNNTFVLENAGKVGELTGNGPTNNQGPGFGEFYNDDWDNGVTLTHSENSQGGLALKPGSGDVVYSAMDPVNTIFFAGGLRRLSNVNGSSIRGYTVVNGDLSNGLFAKAASLGDVELTCGTPQYLQIGNYAWLDTDKDGVQDPCEPPLTGVKVGLYKNGVKIAETTTNASGEYYFSQNGVLGVTWTGTGVDSKLIPNTDYDIVFGETQVAANILTLSGTKYDLTVQNSAITKANDQNDSDAAFKTIAGGSYPTISIKTGALASVDHTYDVGFQCSQISNIIYTKTDPTCTGATANNDGKISFTSVSNSDKYFINSGATSTGTYATASANPASGTAIQSGIPNAGGSYTIRFYNGSDACYKDTTVVVAAVTCSPTCTQPTAGTNTPSAGTCTGATANNDAKVDFTGITNADKIDKSEGATYTGVAYGVAMGTVTGGNASITGLKHNTQYTFRFWNAANDCFMDITVTTPSKTCVIPCPNPNCGTLSTRKL